MLVRVQSWALFFCFFFSSLLASPHFIDGIEFYLEKPKGDGPFPAIIVLHGHQGPATNNGGKLLLDLGLHTPFVNEGIAIISVSIPGYGNSQGERDFSGPASQQAIIHVIDHCKTFACIDEKKIGLYGISKGALLASMVSTHLPDLTFQILEGGSYDPSRFALLPDYLHKIHEIYKREAGTSEEALLARSAVYHADKIKVKTLILHGEFDDRRGLPSAKLLHEKLLDNGAESKLVIYPNELHSIGPQKWEDIIPFCRAQFFSIYGIGITIARTRQIAKISPGSPAELSGKLKVGDTILGISPQNDEMEFDPFLISFKELVGHILGKKGTMLRLRVQHFDYTIEDVVVTRG